MHLYLRWIGRLKKYIFFISDISPARETSGNICKFCLKKYHSGDIVPSKIFFRDTNDFHLDFSSLEFERLDKAVLPIYVLEEAIVIDKRHLDLVKVSSRELKKSFEALIREASRLLDTGFNRIISTFQSGLLTNGTQSHPQIRIFAIKIPNIINELSADLLENDYKILFSTSYHTVVYPFVREHPIELVILSKELNYLNLTTYYKEEELIDLVHTVHKSMLLLNDLPFLGVINLFNEKFYVRIINYNDTEIIWPISAIKAAGLTIISSDLDEYDLFLNELNSLEKRNSGG